MTRIHCRLAAGLALAAGLTSTACMPPPPPAPAPVQTPGTIVTQADSITWTWLLAGEAGTLAVDPVWHTGPGWTISNCVTGITPDCAEPPDAHHQRLTAEGNADVTVWRLGTNDTSPANGGWTADDEARWATALGRTAPDACSVIVKPWLSPDAPAVHRLSIDAARAWMDDVAAALPNVEVVDWRDQVVAPGRLGPVLTTDGIHLAHGPADGVIDLTQPARDALRESMEAALAACA